MVKLAVDCFLSLSTVPLRWVTIVWFLVTLLACVGIGYSLAVRLFTHEWVRGWLTLFAGMLFLGGVQLFSLGVLGEYIGRIYTEIKQRPLFVIDELLQHPFVEGESTKPLAAHLSVKATAGS
jgi:polyisoprenyl-phosphate glycosyltransferase